MIAFLLWYITTTTLGFLAFPLTFHLFAGLADRGYAFSRTLGLLLWGYIFWLLASLGVLRNDAGGLLLAAGIVVFLIYLLYRKIGLREVQTWFKENYGLILSVEILFAVAFASWAFVRAANPEILGTEKPMELAFINAILRSSTFPPHDPWLSGYAISYYYFGYVLVAMLAKITATPGSVAFNLAIALIFSLAACAAYGLIYSLTACIKQRQIRLLERWGNYFPPLLGPAFVLIIGNLEGFLEILHARGIFWGRDLSGNLVSNFWTWLDLRELSQPPVEPFSWFPTRYLWWWRASRVIQDYDLVGNWKEIIDEFPFFSYLLGDLHPHVLGMPFSLLAIGFALNLLLRGQRSSFRIFGLALKLDAEIFWSASLVLGGLAFLNTWDFPIYVFLFCCAYLLMIVRDNSRSGESTAAPEPGLPAGSPGSSIYTLVREFILLAIPLGLVSIFLYLPFYVGFASQAGGILPNLINPTRGAHLWIMFGSLLAPIFVYLLYFWRRSKGEISFSRAIKMAIGLAGGLLVVSFLFGAVLGSLPLIGNLYVGSMGAEVPLGRLFSVALERRWSSSGWLTLVLLIGMAAGIPWVHRNENGREVVREYSPPGSRSHTMRQNHLSPESAHSFAILLIVVGALLVLFTDFFYLRDQFGWRMNTIFKFFYQAWLLWGIAAAFSTIFLWEKLTSRWGYIYRLGIVILVLIGLAYPILGIWTKTNGFKPAGGLTLDGAAHLARHSPEDMAGIKWLQSAPPGIVLEAVGNSYSEYARVATYSGQPALLGWPGHESQWRGGGAEMGNRAQDVEYIYHSNDWDRVRELLDFYHVRYVYIGPLERQTYRVEEAKFQRHLEMVFQSDQVSIYQVPTGVDLPGGS